MVKLSGTKDFTKKKKKKKKKRKQAKYIGKGHILTAYSGGMLREEVLNT